jgi:tetratricopeptide (TPR) repeat protein
MPPQKAIFLQRIRNNRPIGQNENCPHGLSGKIAWERRFFMEDRTTTMNRLVPTLLNGARTVTVMLLLVVVPWIGSIYLCTRAPENESLANSAPPNLLPEADSAHCLLTAGTQIQSSADAEQTDRQTTACRSAAAHTEESADGPKLAGPAQAEKPKTEYASPSGTIIDEDIGELGVSSPPVWSPKEMPLADETLESSGAQAASIEKRAETLDSDGHLSADSSTESTPVSRAPEAVAASGASQSAAPANSMGVDNRGELPFSENAAQKEPQTRSEQLESIARQADQQTRHGLELAGRGALFAARSEMISALRLVAQGLDAETKTNAHAKSLAAGLAAMKEAGDFLPADDRLEADLDLSAIIAGHRSTVLKGTDTAALTSLTALKSYMTFAQAQLAQAGENEVAASMALRGLGKLNEELAKRKGPGSKAAGPKAIACYQAALMVCPRNFMAANDLGVMFARNGNYGNARTMLEYSLSLCQQSTVWHNLAVVYENLGLRNQAVRAEQQTAIAMQIEQARRQNTSSGVGGQVHWVDEKAFADAQGSSAIGQNARQGAMASANTPPQRSLPVAGANQGVLQPASNRYKPSDLSAGAGQFPQTSVNPLPAMQPGAGRISNTPYDTRR